MIILPINEWTLLIQSHYRANLVQDYKVRGLFSFRRLTAVWNLAQVLAWGASLQVLSRCLWDCDFRGFSVECSLDLICLFEYFVNAALLSLGWSHEGDGLMVVQKSGAANFIIIITACVVCTLVITHFELKRFHRFSLLVTVCLGCQARPMRANLKLMNIQNFKNLPLHFKIAIDLQT